MINREDLGNKKLINSIKDEDYKKLVIRNGFCVGLLDFSEIGTKDKFRDRTSAVIHMTRTIKITEYLGLYKHTWSGDSDEVIYDEHKREPSDIDFEIDLNKSLKLDKHTLDGKAIKGMSTWLENTSKDKSLLYIEINTSNNKLKMIEPLEGIKLEYNNITRKFETMTWHRFNRKENDGYPTEFWLRRDLQNRGEVYLDVSPKIRFIFSLMQA